MHHINKNIFFLTIKFYTSMKKLLALFVVAGMVFVGCNNQPKEEEIVAEEVVTEEVVEADATDAAQMPAEEVEVEATEATPAK